MKETQHHEHVGTRIRARRQYLGLSARIVADRAGISHSQLLRIESGQVAGNNRFHIARIAEALHCAVGNLTGVVVPGGPDGTETSLSSYDTLRTILTCDLEFPPQPADRLAPVAALTERVADIITMRKGCDYATITRRLPHLVPALYEATTGPDRDEALRMLVLVYEAASFAVRFTGNPDGATIASDRSRQAALLLGDPVMLAFGEWARAHSALGCGLHDRAALISRKAVGELDQAPSAPGRLEMLGMMHLTLAFSLAGSGRLVDAEASIREAEQLAARTGETDTLALMFGPRNVELWKLAIIADAGDPVDAVPIITGTDVLAIDSASRQCTFYLDAGRVMASMGQHDQAVRAYEAAERIARQRVHGDPLAAETVRGLLDTVRRHAVSARLRGLAGRMGVGA